MRTFINQHRFAFVLMALYALTAHLSLLTNDLPYWDAWYYHLPILDGDKEAVLREWRHNGRILIGEIYWWIGSHFGGFTSYRILSVVAITLSAMLIYALLVRHTALDRFAGQMIALLGISYQLYQVHLVSTTFTYITALPFFILSVVLLLESPNIQNRKTRLGIRVVAQAALLASYISGSFVVCGLIIPFLLWAIRSKLQRPWIHGIAQHYLRYGDFALAAVGYMAAMWFLMPVAGKYSHSRNLDL